MTFDLEERTAKFGLVIIELCKNINENTISKPLISQLIRSSTSIGANYCEADDAYTRKDFKHKINICQKESRETKHWLKMLLKAVPNLEDEIKKVYKEAQELNLIFSSIINTMNKNDEYK